MLRMQGRKSPTAIKKTFQVGGKCQSRASNMIAKAPAGDVIWFLATVNRTAEILRLKGDLDSADLRRSKPSGSSPHLRPGPPLPRPDRLRHR